MYKKNWPFAVVFVAGLTTGLLLDIYTSNNSGKQIDAPVDTLLSKATDYTPESVIKLTSKSTVKKKQIANQTSRKNGQQVQISDREQPPKESRPSEPTDPIEILSKYPPPHITDPNFYRPIPDVQENQLSKEESHDELVLSMKEADLPHEDIEAVITQHEQLIQTLEEENIATAEANANEEEVQVITAEQEVYDLSQSMWNNTDESEEHINQMVNDLADANNAAHEKSEMFDPETGLDHPEPTTN